ncbi:MAG: glycosyltransferase family 4 protein, partial [Nakamurella sp.]
RFESLNMLKAAVAAGIKLHVIVPGMILPASVAAHQAALPGTPLESIARRTGWRSNASLTPFIFASRPLTSDLRARIGRLHAADPFTAVLAVSFRVVVLGTTLAGDLGIPLIVRPHNVESEYFSQLAASSVFPRNIPYRAEAWKLRRAERAIHQSPGINLFADIGERDAQWRAGKTTTRVIHVPPFIDLPPNAERPAPGGVGRTVFFLGALDNSNNVDGIRWFVESCWPELRRQVPDLDLHVVGRRAPTALVNELHAAGVRVTVDAPEVGSLLAAADIFINPVRRGAGVNIKMIEAMSAALPVVSTTTGARGMSWRDGEQLLVADTPVEFSAAVRKLLDDADERARLGAAGRRFVAAELDGVRQINRMRATLQPGPPAW